MAIPPRDAADDAFLREVDEGVRADQLSAFWRRWGVWVVTAVVIFLAVLAGALWWQGEKVRRAGVAGEQFSDALAKADVGDSKAAPIIADLAANGPGGYKPLAAMVQAGNAAATGDPAKAAALYDAIANDNSVAQPLRDAALLRAVRLRFDTMPPAQIIARLQPYIEPGNAWFAIAGEMTALARLKAGQTEPAKVLLIAISRDASAPPTLRNRVQQLALSLGVAPEALAQTAASQPAK